MDYSEPMQKVTDRMKQLQAENAKLKERTEEIVKGRTDLIRNVERTGFKLGMQEANYYSEKQTLTKERQNKEEELRDWKNLLQSNKDDLLKKRNELKAVIEGLKATSQTLNAEKETLYQGLDTTRIEEENKYKEEVQKQKKIVKTLEELCATVKVEKNGEVLTLPTLRKFFDALALYVSQTFCQLIDDYRTERREKNYKNNEFVDAFLAFEERTKNLMGNRQQEFMDRLKISSETLAKSIQYYANQGNREVLHLYPMLASKLRSFKESERVLTKEEVLAVLTLKEKLLIERKDELVELMKACATTKLIPEQIFSIVQFRLSDEIATQLKVEEEDITKAMKSLDNIVDPEVQEAAVKVSEATQKVMASLVGQL
jgi:hypothetical protein